MHIKFKSIAAAAVLAMTGSAHADVIMSSWLDPSQPITKHAHQEWADAIRKSTDGEIDIRLVLGGALIPAKATTQGIADGVAQIGIVSTAYTPSELPVSNALGDKGFATPDPMVLAFAYSDFMMNESAGQEEWRNNGVVYGGGYSTPSYHFICREPLRSVADFQGKRIRLFGGGWARFAEGSLGAISVNMTFGEMFTGLERGALDCVAADPTVLTNGPTIMELVKGFNSLALSPYYTTATWIYNPDFWQGLSEENRRKLLDASAAAMVRLQVQYTAQVDDTLQQAKAEGVELIDSAELQAAYDQWVAADEAAALEIAKTKFGIDDPEALFASFQSYIDKWSGLFEGVDRSDEASLTELVKANLYDKIDVTSYGMD